MSMLPSRCLPIQPSTSLVRSGRNVLRLNLLNRHASQSYWIRGRGYVTSTTQTWSKGFKFALSGAIFGVGLAAITIPKRHADTAATIGRSEDDPTTRPSLGSLLATYIVFSMCEIPSLVDASPKLLEFCTSIPGLKQLTEVFVRWTFFNQVFPPHSSASSGGS
jgi:hypothetical protein